MNTPSSRDASFATYDLRKVVLVFPQTSRKKANQMMANTHKSVVLAKRPFEQVVLGETFSVIDSSTPSASDLKDGEVLLAVNYISIDPGMRDWLDEDRSYMAPVEIGEIMRGFAVGTVRASRHPRFPINSHATGLLGWTEMKLCRGDELQPLLVPEGEKLVDGLSLYGIKSALSYLRELPQG